MRRFYDSAIAVAGEDGHLVLLDGRPLRTPARRPLTAPSAELAQAIAAEWQAQDTDIVPAHMPLTRMVCTVLDRMPDQRGAAIDELFDYAGTDLLCYRALEPLELVQRQQRAWQPVLDWTAESYGVKLAVTAGVSPVAQPEAALARLRDVLEATDDWTLIGVHAATTALGSLLLALALNAQRIDAEAALQASLLDELFEIERWGIDAETERRHLALRRDVEAAERFLISLAR